jgi:hypothetical protein
MKADGVCQYEKILVVCKDIISFKRMMEGFSQVVGKLY